MHDIRGRILTKPTTFSIRSSSFLQSILWRNAKFDGLCDISDLQDYEPRYDPTVIPTALSAPAVAIQDLPSPSARKNDQLHYGVGDFHTAYTSGQTTPTAIAEALIPLIRKGGEHAVAFLQVKEQVLLQKAEEATRRFQQGKPRGVLDGVPVAVKDELQVDGYCRWWGTKVDVTGGKGDKGTAWCVEKLEEEGALVSNREGTTWDSLSWPDVADGTKKEAKPYLQVLGKTNMHECGMGKLFQNSLCQQPSPSLSFSNNLLSLPSHLPSRLALPPYHVELE